LEEWWKVLKNGQLAKPSQNNFTQSEGGQTTGTTTTAREHKPALFGHDWLMAVK